MKNMIKNIFGCVVTLVLIGIMVSYLGHLTRTVGVDRCINKIDKFHELPENTVEVMVYGSSHAWFGYNPMEAYQAYGIGSYNYGCNWQNINTTTLFVSDSFRTQSPKVALIETYYVANLIANTGMNGEIWYTSAIPESKVKHEYLKQCFGTDKEKWLSYYMPLAAFHQNWESVSESNFMKNSDFMDFTVTMGWWRSDVVRPIEITMDPHDFEQKALNDDAIAELDKIVELCKENNTEVVFYTVPWRGIFRYNDALVEYAEKNDCTYLNLFNDMDKVGIDVNTDFCDSGHLNTLGATKVANYLGKYLVENYELTDMRTVENNIWAEAMQ